jgi:ferric-dicitrate binding protein FerR (iron transport regulator)
VVCRQENADVRNYLSWFNGRLVFRRTALPAVARQLAQIYDVRVEIAQPDLADLVLTANIKRDSLPNVLQEISSFLSIDYQLQGNKVILKKK